MLETVLAVLASYSLSGQEAVHAARGLRSIAHGFATLEVAGGFGISAEIRTKVFDACFARTLAADGSEEANLSAIHAPRSS